MKKNQIILEKFRLPLFKAVIWVIVSPTVSQGIDYVEDLTTHRIASEKEKKSIEVYTYAYETEDGKKRYMLFFNPKSKPGAIAHEVKHLINILFSWHGYRLSLSNDEMECYYLEDMVDRVFNILKKYKKLNQIG